MQMLVLAQKGKFDTGVAWKCNVREKAWFLKVYCAGFSVFFNEGGATLSDRIPNETPPTPPASHQKPEMVPQGCPKETHLDLK